MVWKGEVLGVIMFECYNGYRVYGLQVHILRVRGDNLWSSTNMCYKSITSWGILLKLIEPFLKTEDG